MNEYTIEFTVNERRSALVKANSVEEALQLVLDCDVDGAIVDSEFCYNSEVEIYDESGKKTIATHDRWGSKWDYEEETE